MIGFQFNLGDQVRLAHTEERGMVIGRAEYLEHEGATTYLVRYKAADGRQVESWWNQSALAEKT